MELNELRQKMDRIDRELVAVFQQRMELSAQIAQVKQRLGKPIYDAAREQEKLDAVTALLPDSLKGYAHPLYTRLMELSRDYQLRLSGSSRSAAAPRFQMGNIILIGMPGCGKSTVGAALAQVLQRPFRDCDTELQTRYGVSAGDLLRQGGEAAFREKETHMLRELCEMRGIILSTGGGCVTRPENRAILQGSGTVVWLRRELNQIDTASRPLSQAKGVAQLWAEREPLYTAFTDCSVENGESIWDAVTEICRKLGYLPVSD